MGTRLPYHSSHCQKTSLSLSQFYFSCNTTMAQCPKRSRLSNNLQNCIITMYSNSMTILQIAKWTGIPLRTLCRVQQEYEANSTVSSLRPRFCGQPRALEYSDSQVCCKVTKVCLLHELYFLSFFMVP